MANSNFSASNRLPFLKQMAQETYDLLVIGGGITGAGIALDATTRGLKTALVEKNDFAWGTSSRSTKLIHGGLRYLKQLEISLVREVGMERAIVHRNARHIVIPERMLLPIIEGGSLGSMTSSIGLWVYDWLAGVAGAERRRMLSKQETGDREPLLRKDILKGGGLYYEYRTDDARLTIETIKTAVQHGATCVNHAEVIDYVYAGEKIIGARVKDTLSGVVYTVKAKKIVNATGPWVDTVRKIDNDKLGKKRLHLTKGVHIVVPRQKLPLQQAIYYDVAQDKRMVFAIPRANVTYIGTTDTSYYDEIGRPRTNYEDVEYVLNATNHMFPEVNLTVKDVISTWAGLRPLIHEEGKSPSELSRKDEIFYSQSGLISIAGGKLTGYRKMAERVVDAVVKRLKKEHNEFNHISGCNTKELRLGGGNFDSIADLNRFITRRIGEAQQIKATPEQITALIYKYGTNTDLIIEKAFELHGKVQDPTERLHFAELWYGIHHEMSVTLCDYLIRRTGRLYFERPTLAEWYPRLANMMATLLSWNEAKKLRELGAFKREYDEVLTFERAAVMA